MPLSSFPELEGALFPSIDAMKLAEKKVLAQRAEQARREDEQRRQAEAEQRARNEKAARIEAKRVANEQRLQDMARQRAAEVDAEAERMRRQQREMEEEELRRQQEADAARRRAEEEAAKKRSEAAQLAAAKEAERQRRLEHEKQRKMNDMIARMQQEERDAEIRWIKLQMAEGKVRVGKRMSPRGKTEYYCRTSDINDVTAGDLLDWIKSDRDLPSGVEAVEEQPIAEPVANAKFGQGSLSVAQAGAAATNKPRQPKLHVVDRDWRRNHQSYIQDAVSAFDSSKGLPYWRRAVFQICDRLDDVEEKYDAVLSLYCYVSLLLAHEGRRGLKQDSENARTAAALVESPPYLSKILKEAPGNLYALMTLGLLRFAGDDVLADKIDGLRIIPSTVDGWIGQVIATRLYFDFVLWRQNGSPPRAGFEELEFEPEAPTQGSAEMYAFAKNKLQELVAALNLPEVRVGNIPTILSAFDERVAEFLSQRREIKASLDKVEELNKFSVDAAAEAATPADMDLRTVQMQLDQIKQELKRAEDEAAQADMDIQRHEAEMERNRDRLAVLEAELGSN
ncbi:uncharacterized protein MONBRDRAFT_22551 [Monosiga brevicollis MX1]|uniref:Uncharacterized protein n=1 Tax=Monosiga brevicollis TaxID=81824 RepID=A9UQX1_MONBE|nr:uncharacterized protein MONBRDRAFT_22551 [Monosiga brevicollis MX1]EDQ93119.1 predicted protein [Monosiga brevicollis MX1]|eukprot:XP_001742881.1 hypothetical protein [Monosiga brevicollis MX1]